MSFATYITQVFR